MYIFCQFLPKIAQLTKFAQPNFAQNFPKKSKRSLNPQKLTKIVILFHRFLTTPQKLDKKFLEKSVFLGNFSSNWQIFYQKSQKIA